MHTIRDFHTAFWNCIKPHANKIADQLNITMNLSRVLSKNVASFLPLCFAGDVSDKRLLQGSANILLSPW